MIRLIRDKTSKASTTNPYTKKKDSIKITYITNSRGGRANYGGSRGAFCCLEYFNWGYWLYGTTLALDIKEKHECFIQQKRKKKASRKDTVMM